jgi:hypothetical protein
MSYYSYIHEGIYMTSGPRLEMVDWRFPWCSHQFQSLLLGAEVDYTREGSWSRCCEALALLGS